MWKQVPPETAPQPSPAARSRRRFLQRTLWGGLGLAGVLGLQQSLGYALPPGVGELGTFSVKEGAVLRAGAARILEGVADELDPILDELVRWADGYVGRQPPWLRRELGGLLLGLEHSPLWLAGRAGRFTRLDPPGQDATLDAWRGARLGLLRQGYVGLKGLVLMGAYRQPSLLRAIGYDGPPFG